MFKRTKAISLIIDSLSILEVSIRNRGLLNLLDENVIAEDFFAAFLNELYGLNLINANIDRSNEASIDLIDKKNKIHIQVTSDKTSKKVQKTIDGVSDKVNGKKQVHLKILILGTKQKKYTITIPPNLQFDDKTDIWDFPLLIKDVKNSNISILENLEQLIHLEFDMVFTGITNKVRMTDNQALEIIRNFFDRPALHDPIYCEGSLRNFKSALDDLISLLNTGKSGDIITKSRFNFSDNFIKEQLDKIYHKVRALRTLYITHERTGEIDSERNIVYFKNRNTVEAFNGLKMVIIHELNETLRANKLRCIEEFDNYQ